VELEQELPNSIYQTLRSFKFFEIKFIDLSKFKNLKILGVPVSFEELKYVIPFLASRFNRDHFQRLKINIFAGAFGDRLNLGEENFEKFLKL
jgi:hypothetical protein